MLSKKMDLRSLPRKLTMDGKTMLIDSSESAAYHFVYLVNMVRKSTCVAILAGLSAYLSFRLGLLINLNGNDIVTVAVVYPLVFSLNAAYQRRQEALKHLASFKGHAFALRLCSLHWSKETRTMQGIPVAMDGILQKLFADLKFYLSAKDLDTEQEEQIIHGFVALSLLHEKLRADGLPPPELARANGYLRQMLVDFENMKNTHIYRTPSILLHYTKLFLALMPIAYGPVFASIATTSGHVAYGVALAVLFSIVLTALDNTQEVLENPYDGMSPDDIQFYQPTALLHSRVSRTWSEAVPHIALPVVVANVASSRLGTSLVRVRAGSSVSILGTTLEQNNQESAQLGRGERQDGNEIEWQSLSRSAACIDDKLENC